MELETTPASPEVPTGITEEQAAQSLLKKWGASDEEASPDTDSAEESTETEGDEPSQTSEEDPDDAEEQESAEESGEDEEIDIAGEKFKLPKKLAEQARRIESKAKEVEAGATRKFQEAADLRKTAEAQVEQAKKFTEFATQNRKLFTDHEMVTRRLQQIQSIDVMALGNTDPATLAKITAEAQQLSYAKSQIEQAIGQAESAMQEQSQAEVTERFTRLETFAKANIKNWSPEYSETLAKFAESNGVSRQWLRANLTEGLISLIDKAHYGETVRNAKPTEKRVVDTQKTLKPGASGQTKPAAVKRADDAFAKSRKTGNVEDAALALLSRSNARKR